MGTKFRQELDRESAQLLSGSLGSSETYLKRKSLEWGKEEVVSLGLWTYVINTESHRNKKANKRKDTNVRIQTPKKHKNTNAFLDQNEKYEKSKNNNSNTISAPTGQLF